MPKPCHCNRWGTGTCSIPQTKTPAGKEVDTKLQQMLAERAKQDTMWTSTPSDPKYTQEKVQQTSVNILGRS